jgi:hypothetical protein
MTSDVISQRRWRPQAVSRASGRENHSPLFAGRANSPALPCNSAFTTVADWTRDAMMGSRNHAGPAPPIGASGYKSLRVGPGGSSSATLRPNYRRQCRSTEGTEKSDEAPYWCPTRVAIRDIPRACRDSAELGRLGVLGILGRRLYRRGASAVGMVGGQARSGGGVLRVGGRVGLHVRDVLYVILQPPCPTWLAGSRTDRAPRPRRHHWHPLRYHRDWICEYLDARG